MRKAEMDDSDRAEALAAALKDLSPSDQELVRRTLENHPQLSVEEALQILNYFGGL